ncbi:hypothetical protein ACOMHN_029437 [Nucella lapillus]
MSAAGGCEAVTSADDVDTRTETRERVDQPSSFPPPDRREARDLRRDVNAEGPPSFPGSPLPCLERGESGHSPPSSPPPGSRAARVNQLQSDVNSGGGGPSLPWPTGRRADGGQYRSDRNDRGPPSSSSLAPGTRGTQGRPQRHVYTGTGGRNSPRDATLAERRASTGRGEDPLCRHPDSKARGARGGPDTSRQTGLSDYLGNPSRKSTASATRGGGRQSMTPEDPFVFFGDPLRLCCKVTQAERNVTNPDDVMFYRIDSDVTGGQVSWGDEENTSVCWEHQLKEKEDEEGEESAKSILHGTFYYCRLRPAEGQNETYGQCLGYQSVQSDRISCVQSELCGHPGSLWRVVQQVTVRCVTEDGQLQCQWPDITDRFLYPRRLALPRLLYGHTRADNDNCTVTCEGGVCRSCRLQQGRDFQLHDDFVLHVSVQWRYMPDTLYGDPLHTPRPKYHNITLSPRERVKLSAPKDVTVTSPRPRCMQLTWLPGETAGATTLIYWLTIRAEGGQLPVKDEEFAERNMSVPSASREVCGLFPFTVYVLSLQRRADYSDVWSDGIHTSAQTLMAPPDESPEIAPGYLIGPDQLLTIFWKPISENTTNGPDVQYMVNTSRPAVKEGDDHRVLSSLLTNSTHLSVAGDQWRRGDGHMVLHVQAVNQAGPAGNSSRLTLDLTSDGAKKVRGIVEKETKDQMTLNITWHPEQSRDYSYTVHWCLRTGPNSNDCHSQLQWRTLEAKRAWYIQQMVHCCVQMVHCCVSDSALLWLRWCTAVVRWCTAVMVHCCVQMVHCCSQMVHCCVSDGALQMLYSSGCKETPQTYTGSGLSRSLLVTVLAVSGTVAVTLLAIWEALCGTGKDKSWEGRRKRQTIHPCGPSPSASAPSPQQGLCPLPTPPRIHTPLSRLH